MSTPIKAAGICWFTPENYPRVLAVMADCHVLPANFHKWLKQAESAEQRFTAQGWRVHRIDCDPDAFLAWCTARNIDASAQARLTFGSDGVGRLYGKMR